MNNDQTKDLTDSEKLDLILADMGNVKARLAALEAFNEDRSRDTKPLLAELHSYVANLSADTREGFAKVNDRLNAINRGLGTLAVDMLDLRVRQDRVEVRVDEAEQRPS